MPLQNFVANSTLEALSEVELAKFVCAVEILEFIFDNSSLVIAGLSISVATTISISLSILPSITSFNLLLSSSSFTFVPSTSGVIDIFPLLIDIDAFFDPVLTLSFIEVLNGSNLVSS
ncbi:hypothetical protein D3C76_762430 [compost metagenome]